MKQAAVYVVVFLLIGCSMLDSAQASPPCPIFCKKDVGGHEEGRGHTDGGSARARGGAGVDQGDGRFGRN